MFKLNCIITNSHPSTNPRDYIRFKNLDFQLVVEVIYFGYCEAHVEPYES